MKRGCLWGLLFFVAAAPGFGELQCWRAEDLADQEKLKAKGREVFEKMAEDLTGYQVQKFGRIEGSGGEILNPFTDICWSCMGPIRIAGYGVFSDQTDFESDLPDPEEKPAASFFELLMQTVKDFFVQHGCYCTKDHLGIPLSFWEPYVIVEITPHPYKIISFKGADYSDSKTAKLRGAVSHVGDSGRTSFYHVHVIPIQWVIRKTWGLIPGFRACMKSDVSWVPYLSELDPAWKHPFLASLMSLPMYGKAYNYASMEACRKDCENANRRKPTNSDEYWWCAGCLGSYVPFVGYVSNHVGGIQSSYLLLYRALGMRHFYRWIFGLGTEFESQSNYCKKKNVRHLKKSNYKAHLLFPVPDKQLQRVGKENGYCHPLGQAPENGTFDQKDPFAAHWGSKKTFPGWGEDFSYVVFSRMHCCFNVREFEPLSLLHALEDVVGTLMDGVNSLEKIKEIQTLFEKSYDAYDRAVHADFEGAKKAVEEASDAFERVGT